jgi:hypothetical protein
VLQHHLTINRDEIRVLSDKMLRIFPGRSMIMSERLGPLPLLSGLAFCGCVLCAERVVISEEDMSERAARQKKKDGEEGGGGEGEGKE